VTEGDGGGEVSVYSVMDVSDSWCILTNFCQKLSVQKSTKQAKRTDLPTKQYIIFLLRLRKHTKHINKRKGTGKQTKKFILNDGD
jgi:hypothetical protein